ncbi:MAG: ATP-dependent 6-phosphofructokinase, partial [Deltaproteobacteria bacterium]|nr:ATP-dependent 6-phosphofructokinase [Deltaproteobacteria bacterium]
MPTQRDFIVPTLGPCAIESPLEARGQMFADESIRVRVKRHIRAGAAEIDTLSFEEAGPRRRLYFNPAETTAAFVTCGGLSPGLNNVIRSGFLELTHNYGVERILGIRNGYA